MTRKSALVICPGRGTYNPPELGYLARYHGTKAELMKAMEDERARLRQPSLASLDSAERYNADTHTRGDYASLLIHACAMGDFHDIDRDSYEIVAITGNSMGWYIALGCAGAVTAAAGARIVNTMGTYMQEALIGGQLVYPVVDETWGLDAARQASVETTIRDINAEPDAFAAVSIRLGGMLVLAGNEEGLRQLTARLEPVGQFPMVLQNHAAFHTSLQGPVSKRGLETFSPTDFQKPKVPMIDGRGKIWIDGIVDRSALHAYTFGHQVTEPYDFTRAIEVGMREFAPDCLILLGPGGTLGGAIAQSLIGIDWQGLTSRADFDARQADDPILLSMGRSEQRKLVMGQT